WLTDRIDGIDQLDAWIACQTAVQRAGFLGLGDLIHVLRTSKDSPKTWMDGALRRIYQLWLDSQYQKQPILSEFRGDLHDGIVKRFCELDRAAVRLDARRVRDNLLSAA